DIKDGTVPIGSNVSISDIVVTGSIDDTGVFVQVHPDDMGYDGTEYSGLYIYMPGTTPFPQRGDRINVSGNVQDYFGQTQLADVTSVSIISSSNDLPAPTIVDPADVSDTGADRMA